jgi:hypothetical protein
MFLDNCGRTFVPPSALRQSAVIHAAILTTLAPGIGASTAIFRW